MRICLLGAKSCPPLIGGIEVFIYEIGRRLAASGMDVSVVVPRGPGLSDEESVAGIRVVRVRSVRNRFSLKVSAVPHGLLKTAGMRPDVLHANDAPSGVIGSLHLGWKGCLLTVHGMGFSHSEWPTPFRQGGRLLQRIAVNGADAITTTDTTTALMIRRKEGRVRTIPPGVDTSVFSKERYQRLSEFDTSKINLLHAGRLTKVKGTDILMDSLGLLSRDTRDAISLKVIGDGPLAPVVSKAVETYSCVEWLGEVPHDRIAPFFASADMFIMPSRSEGVPISMLEAMSCEVPVVGTIVGGIGTYFDERHLFKVSEPSANAVAVAIESAVMDRASLAGRASEAKSLIEQRFSWDAVTNQYRLLYEEILS